MTASRTVMADIYECGVISRHQFAMRAADGQWFERHQKLGPYGYRWTAWSKCAGKHERAVLNQYAGKARLPRD